MLLANYLFFRTDCEQALAFYTECGLGEVTSLMRYGDLPDPLPDEALRGKIRHARFEGPGILFFASDNHDAEPMRGSAHMLIMESRERTDRLFARLSDNGRVTTPLGVQPWGSYYGKITDRFGVQWMLDCADGEGRVS
ncbi:3-demethylubiquinone-9 3-methyltransferase [Hartmannibacter diazotrophicus]|uniref:3-demethylubiquinone-9 3-methyltransferase n=1 Tax=Hartmannibacter diazotrophicus TaxID=1482074 RepID=A0A2C9D080_9HYPH|nr:VOC family protein [Hartmannibacter diazotrophicus]SON53633.1 3-demethylubiquinone-9 3-methyltransferase [Hartmannibacter diazotrophicus]